MDSDVTTPSVFVYEDIRVSFQWANYYDTTFPSPSLRQPHARPFIEIRWNADDVVRVGDVRVVDEVDEVVGFDCAGYDRVLLGHSKTRLSNNWSARYRYVSRP